MNWRKVPSIVFQRSLEDFFHIFEDLYSWDILLQRQDIIANGVFNVIDGNRLFDTVGKYLVLFL